MLSLYIHIPYCVRKCPYCGFYSTPYLPKNADEFLIALRREAASYQTEFNNRVFHNVYIGGGTPTVLSERQLTEVLCVITGYFQVSEDAEITVEANPNTITKENLAVMQEGGVNRLSIGVQSFSDEVLRALGRLHTAAQAEDAFHLARGAGFQNVGMDLMYGIPEQTMTQWEDTLDAAIGFRPEHLSIYSLSLDEGSLFKQRAEAGALMSPDDDMAADMYEYAAAMLDRAGYRRYEISNFAMPGFECRHNMNYWERGEYLGLGPGAWSFIQGRRYHNIADTGEYARSLAEGISVVVDLEQPGPEQASRETVLLSLRTVKGMDLRRYRKEYGPRLSQQLEANMAPLVAAGLLEEKGGRVILTDRGILLSNEALARLTA